MVSVGSSAWLGFLWESGWISVNRLNLLELSIAESFRTLVVMLTFFFFGRITNIPSHRVFFFCASYFQRANAGALFRPTLQMSHAHLDKGRSFERSYHERERTNGE